MAVLVLAAMTTSRLAYAEASAGSTWTEYEAYTAPADEGYQPPTDGDSKSYRAVLGLGYAAPFAAIGAAAWLTPNSDYAGLWAASLAAPPAVHWGYNDAWSGFRAVLGMTAGTVAGTLSGAALSAATCDRQPNPEEYSFGGPCLEPIGRGVVAGALLGYATWAVVDVVAFGQVPASSDSVSDFAVTPFVSPILSVQEVQANTAVAPSSSGVGTIELSGFEVGASFSL